MASTQDVAFGCKKMCKTKLFFSKYLRPVYGRGRLICFFFHFHVPHIRVVDLASAAIVTFADFFQGQVSPTVCVSDGGAREVSVGQSRGGWERRSLAVAVHVYGTTRARRRVPVFPVVWFPAGSASVVVARPSGRSPLIRVYDRRPRVSRPGSNTLYIPYGCTNCFTRLSETDLYVNLANNLYASLAVDLSIYRRCARPPIVRRSRVLVSRERLSDLAAELRHDTFSAPKSTVIITRKYNPMVLVVSQRFYLFNRAPHGSVTSTGWPCVLSPFYNEYPASRLTIRIYTKKKIYCHLVLTALCLKHTFRPVSAFKVSEEDPW